MVLQLRPSRKALPSAPHFTPTALADSLSRANNVRPCASSRDTAATSYYSRPTPPRTFLQAGLGWTYGIGCGAGPYFGMGVAVDRRIVFGAGLGAGLFCGIGFGAGALVGAGSGFVPIGWTSR